jgi:universal stress protein F
MKKILVAVDGSERSPGVLATSLKLAKLTGAELVLFRAIGLPPAMPPHVWALEEASLVDALRHDAEKYVTGLAAGLPKDVVGKSQVGIGSPWQAICDTAEREKVDLIVVGSHGYSAVDRLLGTTAAKVVNHATRSVLVVRGDPAIP